jgi:hypothetical protein
MVSHLQVCTYPRPVFTNVKTSDALLFFDEVVYDRFWPTFVMDAVA